MTGPTNQDIFDVRKIRRLVELMNEHELSEMDLRQGETRIQLRRCQETGTVASVAPAPPPAAPASASPAAAPTPAAEPAPPTEDVNVTLIKSPMVGTYYSSPDPDSPPYVKVGDHVSTDSTVCIIEAMKVFNQIQAEVSGKVVAVLVENGEPVEFGQALFKIDTSK